MRRARQLYYISEYRYSYKPHARRHFTYMHAPHHQKCLDVKLINYVLRDQKQLYLFSSLSEADLFILTHAYQNCLDVKLIFLP